MSDTALALDVVGLVAGYGAPVLREVTIRVPSGHVVGLFGANGAGKTTTMLAISGAIDTDGGTVQIAGRPADRSLHRRVRSGLAFVAEGRGVFMNLNVSENLRLGRGDPDMAVALFPELDRLRRRKVANLSGGEQQMVALGRALASRPKLLLVDELSLGLAPMVVDRLLEAIRSAAVHEGMGALIVEQHIDRALRFVDYGYVMHRGSIRVEGSVEELRLSSAAVTASYLGLTGSHATESAP